MAEQRRTRYYTYDGTRRSLVMAPHSSSDATAIAYAQARDVWNVVREDGPLAKPIAKVLWKKESR
jgi:hypothetical protein